MFFFQIPDFRCFQSASCLAEIFVVHRNTSEQKVLIELETLLRILEAPGSVRIEVEWRYMGYSSPLYLKHTDSGRCW